MVTLLNSTFAETEGKHLGELFNGSLIPLLGRDGEIRTEDLIGKEAISVSGLSPCF